MGIIKNDLKKKQTAKLFDFIVKVTLTLLITADSIDTGAQRPGNGWDAKKITQLFLTCPTPKDLTKVGVTNSLYPTPPCHKQFTKLMFYLIKFLLSALVINLPKIPKQLVLDTFNEKKPHPHHMVFTYPLNNTLIFTVDYTLH